MVEREERSVAIKVVMFHPLGNMNVHKQNVHIYILNPASCLRLWHIEVQTQNIQFSQRLVEKIQRRQKPVWRFSQGDDEKETSETHLETPNISLWRRKSAAHSTQFVGSLTWSRGGQSPVHFRARQVLIGATACSL